MEKNQPCFCLQVILRGSPTGVPKENQEFLSELNRLIKSRAYEEVEHLIHKLKISSGSIGAKEIYDYCVKFQKALQDGTDIDILMYKSDFTDLFQRLLEEIQYYVEK